MFVIDVEICFEVEVSPKLNIFNIQTLAIMIVLVV